MEKIRKFPEKVRNLSVRKTIILYMVISLVLCFLLSSWIIRCAERIQNTVWWKYVDGESYHELKGQESRVYIYEPVGRPASADMTSESRDEMGRLCKEFEKMRKQLSRNNRELWHALEEERILRAAIAHDIRSPLAVLKGYQEMLSESKKQIGRMEAFVDTVQK